MSLTRTARELDAARDALGKIDDLLHLLGSRSFRAPGEDVERMIKAGRDAEASVELIVGTLKKQVDELQAAAEASARAEERAA